MTSQNDESTRLRDREVRNAHLNAANREREHRRKAKSTARRDLALRRVLLATATATTAAALSDAATAPAWFGVATAAAGSILFVSNWSAATIRHDAFANGWSRIREDAAELTIGNERGILAGEQVDQTLRSIRERAATLDRQAGRCDTVATGVGVETRKRET